MRSGSTNDVRKNAPVCRSNAARCIFASALSLYSTAKHLRSWSSVDSVLKDRIASAMHTNTGDTYSIPMISVPAVELSYRR